MEKILLIALLLTTGFCLDGRITANEPEAFWPPDMVPHPHPPQPAPKDDELA